MKKSYCQQDSRIDRLIDDFIGTVLSVPFCQYTICSTIFPNLFGRYHFVLEPTCGIVEIQPSVNCHFWIRSRCQSRVTVISQMVHQLCMLAGHISKKDPLLRKLCSSTLNTDGGVIYLDSRGYIKNWGFRLRPILDTNRAKNKQGTRTMYQKHDIHSARSKLPLAVAIRNH